MTKTDTKLGIRAVDIRFGSAVIGRVVWVYGVASCTTEIDAWREPRLDSTNSLAISAMINCINNGDPSGDFGFLWEQYFDPAAAP